MFTGLAPQRLLAAIGSTGIMAISLLLLMSLNQPRLGLEFNPTADNRGLRVGSIASDHPNRQRIAAGSVLVAATGLDDEPIALNARTLLPEPDVLDYKHLESFYARQSALDTALRQDRVTVQTESGETVELVTQPGQLASISWVFWAHAAYAILGLLITAGIWAFRPYERAAQLLALSGLGYFLMNLGPAVYGSRELALDGVWFAVMSAINHAGTALHIMALAAMMWVYPRPLGRAPVVAGLLTAAGLSLLADQLRIGPSAAYTHYLPVVAAFVLGVGFAAAQWRGSRDSPVERASLRWIILAIFWATMTSTLLVLIPVLLGYPHVLPQHLAFAPLLIMYVGLAAGITRYRLFDLEAWWLRTWLWVAGGVLVLAVDAVLVFMIGLGHAQSLLLGMLLAGFIYFPVRQWLWEKLLTSGEHSPDAGLPRMTGELVGTRTQEELAARWSELLGQAFQPLEQVRGPCTSDVAVVRPDGLTLEVPHPLGDGCLLLYYAAGGSRLFNRRDLRLAQAMADVGRHAARALAARAAGASEERQRIMSDLHDDLGAKLLTIVHTTSDDQNQALARSALSDLRALVAARNKSPAALPELLMLARKEFEQRVHAAGIESEWRAPQTPPKVILPGRAAANITRILRESVSNAIRHAQASVIACEVVMSEDKLVILVRDNGSGVDPTSWRQGRGSQTMRRRAGEIGAVLEVGGRPERGIQVSLRYPLPAKTDAQDIMPVG